jgi:hypothetical protein
MERVFYIQSSEAGQGFQLGVAPIFRGRIAWQEGSEGAELTPSPQGRSLLDESQQWGNRWQGMGLFPHHYH